MLKNKQIFIMLLCGIFTCSLLSSTAVLAQDNSSVACQRVYGNDRFETAAAISKVGWVQSDTVIIVSGLDYPDALVSSPLSKLNDAPILLSTKNALQPTTLAEITRLNATKAIIIGGTGVIGTNVEAQLKALEITTTRIGGSDRYDTSRKVAEIIGVSHGIIIASGFDFPDPISIAPIAAIKGMPILLTSKDSLNPNIASFIKGKSIPVSYLVGGTGVLSASIESKVPHSKRLSGSDRYTTNTAINTEFSKDLTFDKIYLAAGANYPDALTGSALAAKNNAPMLLNRQDWFGEPGKFMETKNIKHAIILGGEGALSHDVQCMMEYDYFYPRSIPSTSLSLSKNSDALSVGESDTLLETVAPDNATYKAVYFRSSNNDIVSVDDTGKITGLIAGTAVVSAYTSELSGYEQTNFSTNCTVNVVTGPVIKPVSVSLNKNNVTLAAYSSYRLSAIVAPVNATNKSVTWKSSNIAVANVDSAGGVMSGREGTAIITATTADGGYISTCTVTVNPVPVVQ